MASRPFTLRNLLLVLGVWIVVMVIWLIVRAPFAAGQRLECVRYVILMVTQHVKDHGGQWPKNWGQVERANPPSGTPDRPFEWQKIHLNVSVDFGVDSAALVEQGPEAFNAIRPRGGDCGDYTEDVQMLLTAIDAARKAKEAKEAKEAEKAEKDKTPEKADEDKETSSGTSEP